MKTHVKVLLGLVAMAVVLLGFLNFGLAATERATPVPVFVSHPFVIVALGYLVIGFALPAVLGLGAPRVLPPAGPVLSTFRSGGRIGLVNFGGPLIRVSVYADRLTLKPILMGECVIHGSEIQSVGLESRLGRRLVIRHSGPGRTSPVQLFSVPDNSVRQISLVRRDPLPVPSAAKRSESLPGRRLTQFLYGFGVLFGIVVGVVGAVAMAGGPVPFLIGWIVFTVFALFAIVRQYRAVFRRGD